MNKCTICYSAQFERKMLSQRRYKNICFLLYSDLVGEVALECAGTWMMMRVTTTPPGSLIGGLKARTISTSKCKIEARFLLWIAGGGGIMVVFVWLCKITCGGGGVMVVLVWLS